MYNCLISSFLIFFIPYLYAKSIVIDLEWPNMSKPLGEPKGLVEKCWNLSEVEQAYRAFLEKWTGVLEKVSSLKSNEAFVTRILLVHEYRKFLNIDPDLPEDLLPPNWIGYTAYDLFMKLREELTPKANEFFYKVYEP